MKLFVYGTLRRNQIEADDAVICKDVLSIGNQFPGVIGAGEGDRLICGEVLPVTNDMLSVLDVWEGVPELYIRKEIETLWGQKCWIYEYNGPTNDDKVVSWPFSVWIEGAKGFDRDNHG